MIKSKVKYIKPNMRIQLFDEEFNQLSDRMVIQGPEFANGPKDSHKGPLKVEFSLFTKEEAEKAIVYMNKLIGNLPIEEKIKKLVKPDTYTDNREALIKAIREDLHESLPANDLMVYLRERSFVMVTKEFLEDQGYEIEALSSSRVYMITLLKEAKDPRNNKYDPQAVFGFKVGGDGKVLSKWVYVYLYGKKIDKWRMELGDKVTINIKRPEMLKFPHYMIQEERDKWRTEYYRRTLAQKEKQELAEKSKFYLRWETDVKKFNPDKKLI